MMEETIINNKEEREKLVKRVEVLERVKTLLIIPGTDFATVKQVADFYEVEPDNIKRVYQRNKKEIDMDGVCVKSYKEFLTERNVPLEKVKGKVIVKYLNGEVLEIPNRGINVFPRRAILRIGMLLRDSAVAQEVRTQLLNIEEKTSEVMKVSSINKEEKLLMDIALAYKSGEIDKLMAATSAYNKFQSRYIKELEPKAKIVDDMIKNGSSITTTITQRIKDTEATKKWNEDVGSIKLGASTISVLVFVHDFINENGFSPSVREISKAVGLKSTSTVQAHMDKLDALGYIVKEYGKPRNIRVNEEKYIAVIK